VADILNSRFIPLRINLEKQRPMFKQYRIAWTPTIVLLDMEGREHYRFTGFFTPPEMSARILLDGAKGALFLKRYDLAHGYLDALFAEYQGTFAMPEAIYYSSVLNYLSTDDHKFLRQGLERLRKEFPGSEWTMRAKPYEGFAL
jgi:hypothetical protein